MSLIFTQLGADTFVRANENPLNPAHWTTMAPYAPLRVQTNTCRATATSDVNDNFEYFSSVLPPNDQYAEIKLTLLGSGEEFGVELRTDPINVNLYDFDFISNGDGTLAAQIFLFINNNNVATLYQNLALPFAVGDVFRAAAVGSTLYLYQNGTLVTSVQNTTLISGYTGLFISTDTTNQVRLNNFAMGSVTGQAYSVPDCRNYATFPNASRNVQGTLIYDVQTTSNIGGAPVDSRAAGAPVDSRVSAPQNSRASGTFGPGE
jgi:hypothetical protein